MGAMAMALQLTGCGDLEPEPDFRLPAVQAAREAARRAQSLNQMRHISLALLNYESANGRLPPNGAPLVHGGRSYGWRVHLLPFMEEAATYDAIVDLERSLVSASGDIALALQANLDDLLAETPEVYRDVRNSGTIEELWGPGYTNIQGVVGRHGTFNAPLPDEDEQTIVRGFPLGSFSDGTSKTIFAVMGAPARASLWYAPDELIVPDAEEWLEGLQVEPEEHPQAGVSGGAWMYAAYVDGHVEVVPFDVDPQQLQLSLIRDDGGQPPVPTPQGVFATDDALLRTWLTARWQNIADIVVADATMAKLTEGGVEVWNYPDGNGWTRTDFHAGLLAVPPGRTPEGLLRDMANDVNGATGDGALTNWVVWPPAANRQVGDRVDLDIAGPDNGAVGYIEIASRRFCVITLENDTVGWHPVNGIRCWGFVPMDRPPNWTATAPEAARWAGSGPTYMFYTLGIDSPTASGSGGPGSVLQLHTWNALISDLLKENERQGGVSGRYMHQTSRTQPNNLAPGSGVSVSPAGDRSSYYVDLP